MIKVLQVKCQERIIITRHHIRRKINIAKNLIFLKNRTEIINKKNIYHKEIQFLYKKNIILKKRGKNLLNNFKENVILNIFNLFCHLESSKKSSSSRSYTTSSSSNSKSKRNSSHKNSSHHHHS